MMAVLVLRKNHVKTIAKNPNSMETVVQMSSHRLDDAGDGSTHIFDLPLPVLSRILSQIVDPVNAAYVVCSCRLLRMLSKSVPFSLKVSYPKVESSFAVEDGIAKKNSVAAIRTWTRRVLSSIRKQMPMTKTLDLSGCWIVDEDIAAVLADLRCLACLILDGCQKITSSVADALAVSVRLGPRALSLQRCFGLGPAAAGNLLAAAGAEGSQLQCVLLSHLDRLDIPRDPPLLEIQETGLIEGKQENIDSVNFDSISTRRRVMPTIGAGIRVLALHNCGNLGAHEIVAVGVNCPYLEFLFIGGSIEAQYLSRPTSASSEVASVAVSAMVESIKSLRCLRVLEATFFPEFVLQSFRNEAKGVEVWNFCEKQSVRDVITFLDNQADCGGNCMTSNRKAHTMRGTFDGMDKTSDFVLLALRTAVNCSDLRRRTPLHVAANEAAGVEMVQSLLSLGASLQAKDSTGDTALFKAVWNGHAEICRLLLMEGADVLSRNRAGENPLYAAALKGHTSVVEACLSHCKVAHINWQSAEAYGDGWTPLMAAAVADRQDVAKVLLTAAGLQPFLVCVIRDCFLCKRDHKRESLMNGSTQEGKETHIDGKPVMTKVCAQILDARNRYGQTALHIAARRGSLWFVSYLLHAGASLDIRDEYNKRPVDLAQKQKHTLVMNLLKQWEVHLKQARSVTDFDAHAYHEDSTPALPHVSNEPSLIKRGSRGNSQSAASKQVWRAKEKSMEFPK